MKTRIIKDLIKRVVDYRIETLQKPCCRDFAPVCHAGGKFVIDDKK